MNKTLFAAMSGVAFGLVLAGSGYHFQRHMGCRYTPPAQVVPVERSLKHPCPGFTHRVASPPITNLEESTPPSPIDIDNQADQNLAHARLMARAHPNQARQLCRTTMKLYNNNPNNPRVRAAFKLLNTIARHDDEDEDF